MTDEEYRQRLLMEARDRRNIVSNEHRVYSPEELQAMMQSHEEQTRLQLRKDLEAAQEEEES